MPAPAAPSSRRTLVPYLCGAGAILCWASLAAAIGQSLRGLAPETVLLWGLGIAALTLAVLDALRGRRPVPSWPGARVAAFGVCGIWGYHTLLVLALAWAPPLAANVLNYTWSPWIVLLGALLPGHRFTARMALAGLLGFAGVALVIGGEGARAGASALGPLVSGAYVPGYAAALAAGLTWGGFTVFMRRVDPSGVPRMALFCLLGTVPALALALLRGAPLGVPWAGLPALAYLGAVPLGLSFVLWERAARGAQMQVLGLMSFLTPVLSTLLLSATAGLPIGAALFGGLALILGGAALGGTALKSTLPRDTAAGAAPAAPAPRRDSARAI